MSLILAPSILSANFARLGEDVQKVLQAGADWVHVDVMDNHYVPNLTMGPLVCQALRDYGITAPMDVHLMIKPVDSLIPAFAKAGANYITFHPEASEHVDRTIQLIHEVGCKAGIALNPATNSSCLDHLLDKIDMVLVMSVNPGFGGQQFIRSMLNKIIQVRALLDTMQREIRLEVDGGIKVNNIAEVAKAGADTFVVGSAIFETPAYATTIEQLRKHMRAL